MKEMFTAFWAFVIGLAAGVTFGLASTVGTGDAWVFASGFLVGYGVHYLTGLLRWRYR